MCSTILNLWLLLCANNSTVVNMSSFNIQTFCTNWFFVYLGFLSRTFANHRTAGEGGGHFFNSSLPLPSASQTFRHQPGDYCRELTSAHSQQPDLNRESLVSEHKSLTTKLRALLFSYVYFFCSHHKELNCDLKSHCCGACCS